MSFSAMDDRANDRECDTRNPKRTREVKFVDLTVFDVDAALNAIAPPATDPLADTPICATCLRSDALRRMKSDSVLRFCNRKCERAYRFQKHPRAASQSREQ